MVSASSVLPSRARGRRSSGDPMGPAIEKRKTPPTAWRPVVVHCVAAPDCVACIVGGMVRPHQGMIGYAIAKIIKNVNNENVEFVAVGKNRLWTLKAAAGDAAVKGGLRSTKCLEMLQERLRDGLTHERIHLDRMSTPTKAAADADDPMSALLQRTSGSAEKTRKPTGTKRRKIEGTQPTDAEMAGHKPSDIRNVVGMVEMPMTPDADDQRTRQVAAFVGQKGTLHLRVSDLPWAIEYLCLEMNGGNVPEPPDPDEDDDEDGADGCGDGLRCVWSPAGSWTVTVRKGALKGQSYHSKIQDLTQEKWDKGAAIIDLRASFQKSSRPQQKDVLLAYIQSVAREEMAAADSQEQGEASAANA